MRLERLGSFGINYKKGVSRCMGNPILYESALLIFLEDDCIDRARDAIEISDYTSLFEALHELKGMCGNIELTDLFDSITPIIDLLRIFDEENPRQLEKLSHLFNHMEISYMRSRDAIMYAME